MKSNTVQRRVSLTSADALMRTAEIPSDNTNVVRRLAARLASVKGEYRASCEPQSQKALVFRHPWVVVIEFLSDLPPPHAYRRWVIPPAAIAFAGAFGSFPR